MYKIETIVTYVDSDDLTDRCKDLLSNNIIKFDEINRNHLKDKNLNFQASIIIFKHDLQYKVLKSRY